MHTLDRVMGSHQVAIPEHLEAQAEIPLISDRPQRQGDVYVIPQRPGIIDGAEPVPAEGVPVVRSEAGGNTHLLVAEGFVSWKPQVGIRSDLAAQGTLVVDQGSSAYLIHPEHGATGMGPGHYTIRRQREQADEIRIVAD
jgi:hypothetical protein